MKKKGNPENIKGQGFHTHPERINHAGRPKKIPALDTLLAEVLGFEEGKPEVTASAIKILQALVKKANRGDVRAAEVLLDRAYGKARGSLDITSKGESLMPQAHIDYTMLSQEALKEILTGTKINSTSHE